MNISEVSTPICRPKRKMDSRNEQPIKQRPSESRKMTVEVRLPSKAPFGRDLTLDFKAGVSIGLPTTWQFFMRPIAVEDKKCLALYLRLLSAAESEDQIQPENKKIIAKFSAELMSFDPYDNPGKKSEAKEFDYNSAERGKGFGIKDFVNIQDLQHYMFNGKLKIVLHFTMFGYEECSSSFASSDEGEPMAKKRKTFEELSREQWGSQIYEGLLDGTMDDLVVKTSDFEDILTNRFIMAVRSSYFKKEMEKVERVGDKYILKVGFPHQIMRLIICHIVTGSLPTWIFDDQDINEELLGGLTKAANDYELVDLRDYLATSSSQFMYEMK